MIEDIVKYDLLIILLIGSVFLISLFTKETINIVKEIQDRNKKNKKTES